MCADRVSRRVVLIVDDELLHRVLATEYFKEAGYEVVEAGCGADALARISERPDIDAVFTDVRMPGRPDGLALARTARQQWPNCAIVVVSGDAWPGPNDLAERARFLRKPYDGASAVRMVDELLRTPPPDAPAIRPSL